MKYINNCKIVDKLKNTILLTVIFISFFISSSNVQAATISNDKTLNSKIGWTIDGKKLKSGNLSTDYTIEQALNDINKFQLNTINIPVIVEVNDIDSSNMLINKTSENKAIDLIKQLKNKNSNINIILEPYPWIAQGAKAETEWKPNNMNDFFTNWRKNK